MTSFYKTDDIEEVLSYNGLYQLSTAFSKKNVIMSMSDFKGHLFHLSMSTFNSALCSKGCHLNKKLSQNIQLWKFISLPIFIEPMNFFGRGSLNTPKIGKRKKVFTNINLTGCKTKKMWRGGGLSRTNGSQNFCFYKCNDICFYNFCDKHPLMGKKRF